jgi:aconitate decarboxylase
MTAAELATAQYTSALAAFAAELRYDMIPAPVTEHLTSCLLDTVGCGLFGSTLPWTRILSRTVRGMEPDGRGTVWGTGESTSVLQAALVNGSAVHGFELDDLHPRSIVHPGSVVVPAALAAAEHVGGVAGADLITAIVAGYEVAARVGMSVGAAHLVQGWHPTGTHGALGAAAAAGSILRLDATAMQHCLGIAGTQSGGLMAAQYASMVKRFHAGRAAQSGLYAACLAANCYTGITDLFEAEYGGYCTTFSPLHELAPLSSGLGTVWETLAVGFKPYSTNGSCHPSIDILLEMYRDGLRAADVDHIEISASTATCKHVGWPYVPGAVTTAQMNLGYIVAVTLTDGDAFVDQFTEERIVDPVLAEFAHRVHVHADSTIDAQGDGYRHATLLAVYRKDGVVLRAERHKARGSAALPMTRAEVRDKYRKLAVKALTPAQAEHLEHVLTHLADATELSELISAIGPIP